MATNQKYMKLKENYEQRLNDFISEIRKNSIGWQTIVHPPKANESIEDLVRLNKEMSENASKVNLHPDILNIKMITKDYAIHSFGNGKIELAGAIRISDEQMLWPLVTIEKNEPSIVESRAKVDEFLVGKGININEDLELIKSLNRAYKDVPKSYKAEATKKMTTNLYAHKQNLPSHIVFDKGDGKNLKF